MLADPSAGPMDRYRAAEAEEAACLASREAEASAEPEAGLLMAAGAPRQARAAADHDQDAPADAEAHQGRRRGHQRALADAAGYREWRASQWCARCEAEPEGACEDHLGDAALTGTYRALTARLADALPLPEGEARPDRPGRR